MDTLDPDGNSLELTGATPPPRSVLEPEEFLIHVARRSLRAWGLSDERCLEGAARRIVRAVIDEAGSRDVPCERVLSVAYRWVASFAGESTDDTGQWFWTVRRTLARAPRAFLRTPMPRLDPRDTPLTIPLLPPTAFSPMRQQHIEEPFGGLVEAARAATRQIRTLQLPETPKLAGQP